MRQVLALLTDFGLVEPYRAQLSSVLLRRVPDCQILDLSHQVEPHNILQGAFFLQASWSHLPKGCIVLAVVDPGVGSSRRIVLLRCGDGFLLAPDNGLCELMLRERRIDGVWELPANRHPADISPTFHGRDVFAPLAGDLANGQDPEELGSPVSLGSLVRLELKEPRLEQGRLEARVLHVDRFGNCVLDLPEHIWQDSVMASKGMWMEEPLPMSLPWVRTYAEITSGAAAVLSGSQGYLELAADRRSCASMLGLDIGCSCVFRLTQD